MRSGKVRWAAVLMGLAVAGLGSLPAEQAEPEPSKASVEVTYYYLPG